MQGGYNCGITTKRGYNSNDTPIFELNRIGLRDVDSINQVLVKSSGLWGFIEKHIINRLSNQRDKFYV